MGETDDFEWDDTKEQQNLNKHGMSLRLAAELFNSDFWIELAAKKSLSDTARSIAVGPAFGRLLSCV
jgi:uncharacterized DUF497 family protein